MKRREFIQTAAFAAAASASVSSVKGQEGGPFSLPTTRFRAGAQHELPAWAFRNELPVPAVPLPTAIGTFEELASRAVFGLGDTAPLGDCFHGVALEWGATPKHWAAYGADLTKMPGVESWNDKRRFFLTVPAHDGSGPISNWSGFKIKCYKLQVLETHKRMRMDAAFDARLYGYNGLVPGPTLKMRLGEPVVVRYENHLETEVSVHLHGGHNPSHSDGFPSFYVLQGQSRDYFYPNMLPLYISAKGENGKPSTFAVDVGESQSTMWYHDHAMDATAYNASKGLAGVAPCFGEAELKLIHDHVLPGLGARSCTDYTNIPYTGKAQEVLFDLTPEGMVTNIRRGADTTVEKLLKQLEDPENPGYFRRELEPYYNPYDIPLVLQDKVIDQGTGQIAYDLTDHNGYLGDSFFVNGEAWPYAEVANRKYRLRILDGANARVFRLRIMKAEDFAKAQRFGIDALDGGGGAAEIAGEHGAKYDRHSSKFLRIGKDSWLWSEAVEKQSIVLAMANRADVVVDFGALTKDLGAGWDTQEFVLVNTMPQFDGRGPKVKLEDGGDPRVLPLPFDAKGHPLVELNRPIGLLKFVVKRTAGAEDATIEKGTPLIATHRPIKDDEVLAVREFIFERGKGAWQINGRFYDPYIANSAPVLDGAEEWVLRNGGGGWWHPIHIHLESHQLISYEKDFAADEVVNLVDPPPRNTLLNPDNVTHLMDQIEVHGLHDTQVLGPNTVARIRMRHRTWNGPFVFHCHNLEHEDMRMMYNFEPVAAPHNPNIAPAARTHGNDVTLNGDSNNKKSHVGEPPWHHAAVPKTPITDAGQEQIPARPKP